MIRVNDWSDIITQRQLRLNRKYSIGFYIWKILTVERIGYDFNSEIQYIKKLKTC